MINELFHAFMKAGAMLGFATYAVVLFGKGQTTWAIVSLVISALFFFTLFIYDEED